ncbi:MAG: hypothetical protein CBD58_05050 [bacterium TMED198]|nr:MAG: hypothetical protein CBD58_05050 [bacterium TMED198]
MIKYIKYSLFPFLLLLLIYLSAIGGASLNYFITIFSLFVIVGDLLLSDDITIYQNANRKILNFILFSHLPLLFLYFLCTIYMLGNSNPVYFESILNKLFNLDISLNRQNTSSIHFIGYFITAGLFFAGAGINIGHELTHRKNDKISMFFGNWLLAFSWDCAFALEHVQGHHKNVCTSSDPATSKRGENIYKFLFLATIKEQIDAWRIERTYLKRNKIPLLSAKNRMIRGYIRSAVITVISFYIGGLTGMIAYLIIAISSKFVLEAINYIEHHGLVRVPGTKVRPEHSWNSNAMISGVLLFNLTRHSAHHEKANLEFWQLPIYKNAPMLPAGYLSMIYLALLLPIVYHWVMSKHLLNWDKKYATPDERELASKQNKSSGIFKLVQQV